MLRLKFVLAIGGGKVPLFFKDEVSHTLDTTRSSSIKSVDRMVRSRLYFSSESHLHAFVTILKLEFNYCHAVIALMIELDMDHTESSHLLTARSG